MKRITEVLLPFEIMFNHDLTNTDKLLFFFVNENLLEETSNKYLSTILQCSEQVVTKSLQRLEIFEYLIVKKKNRKRKISINKRYFIRYKCYRKKGLNLLNEIEKMNNQEKI